MNIAHFKQTDGKILEIRPVNQLQIVIDYGWPEKLTGGSKMKKTMIELFSALSDSDPDASFGVLFWDGEQQNFGEGKPGVVIGFTTQKAARRFMTGGILGFGEEYVAGTITVDGDFERLTHLGTHTEIDHFKFSPWTKLNIFFQYVRALDTTQQAPKNIASHYDLGNNFFQLWLDKSMTYSCAYFKNDNDTLEQAQLQKYEHVCRKLQLKNGDRLLDVGCGWGGMLIYAAKHYAISGVGCTLSKEQHAFATERIRKEGLDERLEIRLQDYRELNGVFDKFVSIGMFEHVGKKFISQFVKRTKSLLKPGGIGLLHTIGKDKPSPGDPWMMRYIFPGGYIPLLDETIRALGKQDIVPTDVENLRLHYARTLDEWYKRVDAHSKQVEEMFDASFIRMWRMFLVGSAAGFRFGNTRLYQITFTKGLNNSLPMTREHLYFK